MKTTISLQDDLFDAAERMASLLGVSRSELFAKAVSEYVDRHTDRHVTDQLNEVYAEGDLLDKDIEASQVRLLTDEEWS